MPSDPEATRHWLNDIRYHIVMLARKPTLTLHHKKEALSRKDSDAAGYAIARSYNVTIVRFRGQ